MNTPRDRSMKSKENLIHRKNSICQAKEFFSQKYTIVQRAEQRRRKNHVPIVFFFYMDYYILVHLDQKRPVFIQV